MKKLILATIATLIIVRLIEAINAERDWLIENYLEVQNDN